VKFELVHYFDGFLGVGPSSITAATELGHPLSRHAAAWASPSKGSVAHESRILAESPRSREDFSCLKGLAALEASGLHLETDGKRKQGYIVRAWGAASGQRL
jgi:hypothetical protein